MAFQIYTDAALTTPLSGNIAIASASVDRQFWLGSTTSGVKAVADAGGDITITPSDSDTGTTPAATIVKLATTQAGLTGATGGAALTVGTQVLGGAGNGFEFWTRVANPLTGVSKDTTIGFTTNALREEVV